MREAQIRISLSARRNYAREKKGKRWGIQSQEKRARKRICEDAIAKSVLSVMKKIAQTRLGVSVLFCNWFVDVPISKRRRVKKKSRCGELASRRAVACNALAHVKIP
jgi:hypothetical protein